MNNTKKPLITVLSCTFALVAYLIADSVMASEAPMLKKCKVTSDAQLVSEEEVLKNVPHCNK
ncbi:hypothetical protein CXF85_20255 [Colwellia sp. 75C3]|uniref:hypothetical protein n=1 Tax=Colwellia sp. 75C3 TaxID=888425 RepID=UPI000C31CED8|nr:hypothetical protein [Colwellia sp. 75C3]PKG81093.1 hypothetical protein CXF85_20255 [Colwellia sp. 75C3]